MSSVKRMRRQEFPSEAFVEEVYEVGERKFNLNLRREGRTKVDLWLDLLFSGCDLSEAGQGAVESLIEEYARRSAGHRRLVNSGQVMTAGNSIVFMCYQRDVPELTAALLLLVADPANLQVNPLY